MGSSEAKPVIETALDDAEEARIDTLAEAEIAAGQGVPHERVRDWLLKLGRGEKAPLPTT